jgi:predicted dehydrogenase
VIDITVIGGGATARICTDILSEAGFRVRHGLDFDNEDRSPIILDESAAAPGIARQAVDAGRHLLIATPASFSTERLAALFAARRRAQALFLWSSRRHHPGYRFVAGLVESDATWRPRYVRHQMLTQEPPSPGLSSWTLLESVAVVLGVTNEEPESVAASGTLNPVRNAPDLVSASIAMPSTSVFVQVALGETVERRETLIAADGRKAHIDEMDEQVPVRVTSDGNRAEDAGPPRWLSCSPPTSEQLARRQCISFLDATLHPELAQEEAALWVRALATAEAAQQSMYRGGIEVPVERGETEAKFRVLAPRAETA